MSGTFDKPRVLVVEDQVLVAMEIVSLLQDLGCEVVGPAARLAMAVPLARDEPLAAAVLDVNLEGEMIDPVAELLDGRGIPFVFTTGYGRPGIPANFRDRPHIEKPFLAEDLKAAILGIIPAH